MILTSFLDIFPKEKKKETLQAKQSSYKILYFIESQTGLGQKGT